MCVTCKDKSLNVRQSTGKYSNFLKNHKMKIK